MLHRLTIRAGATSKSVRIRIIDSTDGTPETGVTAATSGLDLKYHRDGAAAVDITEADLTALTDAWSSGGLKHIGQGYYRVDVPDLAFAAGADSVLIFGTVTGMIVIGCEVELAAAGVDVIAISGDAAAADNLENAFDDTAGPVSHMGIVDQGTAQSATSTSVVLRAAAAFADDALIGCTIAVFGSTQGYWQTRSITDSVLSTDTVTVDAWTVTPSGTITYKIFASPPVSASLLPAVNVTQVGGANVTSSSGRMEVNTTHIAGASVSTSSAQLGVRVVSIANDAITAAAVQDGAIDAATFVAGAINAAAIASDAITAAKIATGAITAAKFAAGAIDAAAIATNAIDADALAADAVDEIWDEQIGDGTVTARQSHRLSVSVLGGKVSGMGTTTVVFRNLADTKDVLTATVDSVGNRTAATRDLT